jgi:nitroreductase
VSEEDLATILEAGRLAPSAKNWQPWNSVLVTDRDQLRDLTGVWQGAWHVGGAAAAIAIVAQNPPEDRNCPVANATPPTLGSPGFHS